MKWDNNFAENLHRYDWELTKSRPANGNMLPKMLLKQLPFPTRTIPRRSMPP